MATTAKKTNNKTSELSEDELIAMFLQSAAEVPFSMHGDPKGETAGSFESTFDAKYKAAKKARK